MVQGEPADHWTSTSGLTSPGSASEKSDQRLFGKDGAHPTRGYLLTFGTALAWPGWCRGVRRVALTRGCPPVRVWLSSGLRPRRAPWRGVAREGTARLEVALPVLADNPMRRG